MEISGIDRERNGGGYHSITALVAKVNENVIFVLERSCQLSRLSPFSRLSQLSRLSQFCQLKDIYDFND
jgi:hypothetical protein